LTGSETIELAWPSGLSAIPAAAAAVASVAQRVAAADHVAHAADVAVREAVANAVVHGNRHDAAKRVRVRVTSTAKALEITVHDEGPGFDPAALDPSVPDHRWRCLGRGLWLIRSFMDHAEWRVTPGGGTAVRMIKAR
jgi:serine/threonine-protein kinase RsbW